jgi:hypothetical protein
MHAPFAVQQPSQFVASHASGLHVPVSASQPVPEPQAVHASPPLPHAVRLSPGTHWVPPRQQPSQSLQSATGTHCPAAQVSPLSQRSHASPGMPQVASPGVCTQRSPSQQPLQLSYEHALVGGVIIPSSSPPSGRAAAFVAASDVDFSMIVTPRGIPKDYLRCFLASSSATVAFRSTSFMPRSCAACSAFAATSSRYFQSFAFVVKPRICPQHFAGRAV